MNETQRDGAVIGVEMVQAGLPAAFVLRIVELARESEGVDDLLHLWAEAPDAEERQQVEADLYAMIEDREPTGGLPQVPSEDGGEALLATRRAQKEHLRRLVASHGGVSEVARRADIPQPSLSRLLGSVSEPRPATLNRLAAAMGLAPSALLAPVAAAPQTEIVLGSPTAGAGARRAAARLERRVLRLERSLEQSSDGVDAA